MRDTPPHLKPLEEIEREGISGLAEVLHKEGLDAVRHVLWDATGWRRDYSPTTRRNSATKEQKRVGWEMSVLLPPEQQAERLNSFPGDEVPPNSAERAYGLGLGREYGWVGHTGELPGFNTAVYYHPELDATVVVEVNSDIPSDDCPPDRPTMTDAPQENIPCADPAVRIFGALAEALGQPFGPEQ
jgi:CubicO group peptidase (beta-lactamase class C family)